MYSQRDEERTILDVIGHETGRFLDIGAADGKTFSNVRALIERGWAGVLVDGAVHHVEAARNHYAGTPGIECVCAVITPDGGDVVWHESADLVSSIIPEHVQKWAAQGVKFSIEKVASMSVARLLEVCPGPYQMISIDTEGTSLDILRRIIPLCPECKLYVVEYDDKINAVRALLYGSGYTETHVTVENVVAWRKA